MRARSTTKPRRWRRARSATRSGVQAAAAYKVALDAAPDRDEAPEAAMNGAYAYKQVGEYDKAIEMYELFIARYGNDKQAARSSRTVTRRRAADRGGPGEVRGARQAS